MGRRANDASRGRHAEHGRGAYAPPYSACVIDGFSGVGHLPQRGAFRRCGGDQGAFRSPPGLLRGLLPDEVDFMPQLSRRGAPVARRDPCKRTFPKWYTRMGVERAEGPSRGPGAAPLAGCQGSALTGVQGQSPWQEPRGQRPLGFARICGNLHKKGTGWQG